MSVFHRMWPTQKCEQLHFLAFFYILQYYKPYVLLATHMSDHSHVLALLIGPLEPRRAAFFPCTRSFALTVAAPVEQPAATPSSE